MSLPTTNSPSFDAAIREIDRLNARVAELLAALEDLADLHDGDDPVGYTRDVARSAIAKAKGE